MSKALADRVVARLGGYEYRGLYTIPSIGGLFKPDELVNDGRVMLAMMEKFNVGHLAKIIATDDNWYEKVSCPAIIEACCDWLEGKLCGT